MRSHLKELERTQWLSRPELEAWQFTRIQRVLKYAYEHVPYYHRLYKRLDIHPNDIKNLEDFANLPFLTKEDINNHLDDLVSPELRDKAKMDQTGGSTGEPARFFLEKAWHWWDAALEFRGRGWYGLSEGDKIAVVWGALRDIFDQGWKPRLKSRILRHQYLNAFSMTEAKMQEFAELLVRWQPAMFRAYASALSLFAQYIKEHRITGIRPRFIETTAEKVTGPQRQLLEEVFQCKVADWYSAREFGTIAFQCEMGGLHVCETRYLEIIANGKVAQPGQMGEVVVTSLHQFAMPFIRYKIDDMAVYEPGPCTCGRGMPILREVVGRTEDFTVTADGQFVHGAFFEYIFMFKPEVFRYQVYQPDKKHLEVRLVCKQKVDSAWLAQVHNELQTRFGANMQISLQVVDEIKLTPAGKHRFIISDVKPDFV
jgi:phenylacetate-CoA ligase